MKNARRRARPARRALPAGLGRALRVAGIVIAGLGLLGLAFGVPPVLLIGLAVAVLAIAVVLSVLPDTEVLWPIRREEGTAHGWSHLSMLAHGIAVADSSPWEFEMVVQPRLRRLAGAALVRRGLDWTSPEAADLLGPDLHTALSTAEDADVPPGTPATPTRLPTPSPSAAPGPSIGHPESTSTAAGRRPAAPAPRSAGARTALVKATLDAVDRLDPPPTTHVADGSDRAAHPGHSARSGRPGHADHTDRSPQPGDPGAGDRRRSALRRRLRLTRSSP